MSVDHNMDTQYQRRVHVNLLSGGMPRIRSLRRRRRRRTYAPTSPTMISMRKAIHAFPFLSCMGTGLLLAAFRAPKAPLKPIGGNLAISLCSLSDVLYFSLVTRFE